MPEAPADTVWLNDEVHPWSPDMTLDTLLQRAGHDPLAVATAVNGEFVARSARAGTALRPGDRVTAFKAIVGG